MGDIELNDGVAIATCGDVFICIWKADSTIPRIQWLVSRVDTVTAETTHDYIMVQIILPSSNPPDDRTRDLAHAHLKRLRSRVRQFATLAAGDTFRASMVRSVMRAMMLFTGQSSIHAICSDEHDIIRRIGGWASPHTPSANHLRAAIAEAYAALETTHKLRYTG